MTTVEDLPGDQDAVVEGMFDFSVLDSLDRLTLELKETYTSTSEPQGSEDCSDDDSDDYGDDDECYGSDYSEEDAGESELFNQMDSLVMELKSELDLLGKGGDPDGHSFAMPQTPPSGEVLANWSTEVQSGEEDIVPIEDYTHHTNVADYTDQKHQEFKVQDRLNNLLSHVRDMTGTPPTQKVFSPPRTPVSPKPATPALQQISVSELIEPVPSCVKESDENVEFEHISIAKLGDHDYADVADHSSPKEDSHQDDAIQTPSEQPTSSKLPGTVHAGHSPSPQVSTQETNTSNSANRNMQQEHHEARQQRHSPRSTTALVSSFSLDTKTSFDDPAHAAHTPGNEHMAPASLGTQNTLPPSTKGSTFREPEKKALRTSNHRQSKRKTQRQSAIRKPNRKKSKGKKKKKKQLLQQQRQHQESQRRKESRNAPSRKLTQEELRRLMTMLHQLDESLAIRQHPQAMAARHQIQQLLVHHLEQQEAELAALKEWQRLSEERQYHAATGTGNAPLHYGASPEYS